MARLLNQCQVVSLWLCSKNPSSSQVLNNSQYQCQVLRLTHHKESNLSQCQVLRRTHHQESNPSRCQCQVRRLILQLVSSSQCLERNKTSSLHLNLSPSSQQLFNLNSKHREANPCQWEDLSLSNSSNLSTSSQSKVANRNLNKSNTNSQRKASRTNNPFKAASPSNTSNPAINSLSSNNTSSQDSSSNNNTNSNCPPLFRCNQAINNPKWVTNNQSRCKSSLEEQACWRDTIFMEQQRSQPNTTCYLVVQLAVSTPRTCSAQEKNIGTSGTLLTTGSRGWWLSLTNISPSKESDSNLQTTIPVVILQKSV